jgi:hypothetical protein
MAGCNNVETYAAAQVFYWVGYAFIPTEPSSSRRLVTNKTSQIQWYGLQLVHFHRRYLSAQESRTNVCLCIFPIHHHNLDRRTHCYIFPERFRLPLGFWRLLDCCTSCDYAPVRFVYLQLFQSKEDGAHVSQGQWTYGPRIYQTLHYRIRRRRHPLAQWWTRALPSAFQSLFIPGQWVEVNHDYLYDYLWRSIVDCLCALREVCCT